MDRETLATAVSGLITAGLDIPCLESVTFRGEPLFGEPPEDPAVDLSGVVELPLHQVQGWLEGQYRTTHEAALARYARQFPRLVVLPIAENREVVYRVRNKNMPSLAIGLGNQHRGKYLAGFFVEKGEENRFGPTDFTRLVVYPRTAEDAANELPERMSSDLEMEVNNAVRWLVKWLAGSVAETGLVPYWMR